MPKSSKISKPASKPFLSQGMRFLLLAGVVLLFIFFPPAKSLLNGTVEQVGEFASNYLVDGIEKATEDVKPEEPTNQVEPTP